MSDTKLTYELDGSGRITVKATNEGVLLSKEEAECVAAHIAKQRERIAELESLVRDVWAEYSAKADSSFHPAWEVDDELAERMAELGLLDGDAE